MGARDLLAELAAIGVAVTLAGEQLLVRPASSLTADMISALRASKSELVDLLVAERRTGGLLKDLARTDPTVSDAMRAKVPEVVPMSRTTSPNTKALSDAGISTQSARRHQPLADHHDVVVARTCADCQHLGPRGTCFAPVAAGLRSEREGLGVEWPPDDHAQSCAAFRHRPVAPTQDWPHKLTRERLAAIGAGRWSEPANAPFQARPGAIQRRGFGEQVAESAHAN